MAMIDEVSERGGLKSIKSARSLGVAVVSKDTSQSLITAIEDSSLSSHVTINRRFVSLHSFDAGLREA